MRQGCREEKTFFTQTSFTVTRDQIQVPVKLRFARELLTHFYQGTAPAVPLLEHSVTVKLPASPDLARDPHTPASVHREVANGIQRVQAQSFGLHFALVVSFNIYFSE